MRLIKGTLDFQIEDRCVVTLGKFDGVHRGHQALIDRVVTYVPEDNRKELIRTVISFDTAPTMILSKKERRKMLEKRGIDLLIECPFIAELISMDPETFVKKMLVDQLHVAHVVVGEDFRFGYHRAGNPQILYELGKKYGFTVEVVEDILDGDKKISSTYIREALSQGQMEKVNELLGYEYYITGEVVHGRQVGRTIGIPTTNLIPSKSKMLPPNGVYVTRSTVGKETYVGMTNIGCKPTVEGGFVGVETYLFDCDADLYGEKEKVRVLHYIRPEKKFDGLEQLKAQLKLDENEIRTYVKNMENQPKK